MGRTRTVYLPTRQDRMDQRAAEEAEFGDVEVPEAACVPAPGEEPEFESIEAFAEMIIDDDRTSFTFAELSKLQTRLKRHGASSKGWQPTASATRAAPTSAPSGASRPTATTCTRATR